MKSHTWLRVLFQTRYFCPVEHMKENGLDYCLLCLRLAFDDTLSSIALVFFWEWLLSSSHSLSDLVFLHWKRDSVGFICLNYSWSTLHTPARKGGSWHLALAIRAWGKEHLLVDFSLHPTFIFCLKIFLGQRLWVRTHCLNYSGDYLTGVFGCRWKYVTLNMTKRFWN